VTLTDIGERVELHVTNRGDRFLSLVGIGYGGMVAGIVGSGRSTLGAIARSKGMQTNVTSEQWKRVDGQKTADMDRGKLSVVNSGRYESDVFPPRDHETLAGLSTEPQRLLDWVRDHLGAGEQHDAEAFNVISKILGAAVGLSRRARQREPFLPGNGAPR
jgi:hypothetical protein